MDPEDYPRLAKHKWYAVKEGRSIYAVRSVTVGKRQQKGIRMHREIIKAEDGKLCDHINHNGLDNRKTNLRQVNRAQNSWNKRKQKGRHSSQYKGVSWFRVDKKWQARIQANGEKIFLGYFHNEIDAAKAYDQAAKKYHGEFAKLNFHT
ncbi:MAG: HNH endonuclease [Planctomycetota bacterium]